MYKLPPERATRPTSRERIFDTMHVLQAMVGDHGVEAMIGKRQPHGVRLNKSFRGTTRRPFQVEPDDQNIGAAIGVKAAGQGSKVQDTRPGRQIAQNFIHAARTETLWPASTPIL